jgi:hypothetical protein
MPRATWGLAATSLAGLAASLWLYLDNRELRSQLGERSAMPAGPSVFPKPIDPPTRPDQTPERETGPARTSADPAPKLPDTPSESRLERRNRRQLEFAAMFGRLDGETDDEYRERIGSLIAAGLLIPRQRVGELRRQVEDKAGVTAEQSRKLDQAFDKVYGEVLDYTNKAIADGLLSPYERNVAGWLEYAGGLGSLLGEANGQIGRILSPQQVKAIADSGFEWGEYLGVGAPWEKLNPPPDRPR